MEEIGWGRLDEPRSLSLKAGRCEEVENDEVAGRESRVAQKDVRRGARATRVQRKDMAMSELGDEIRVNNR